MEKDSARHSRALARPGGTEPYNQANAEEATATQELQRIDTHSHTERLAPQHVPLHSRHACDPLEGSLALVWVVNSKFCLHVG